ncbi:MAG: putative dehydrogenase like protein, partial [Deltaproteobacteria bacterium]|nr:putative dehydrogenase like protein [Deltaproteobacteria bacterium]
PIAAHVAKAEEIKNLVAKTMEAFGRIDILVNNAATNPTMDQALTVDERAWDAIMNLNLKGLFFLSQAVARIMKEKGGGKIINVSSIAGISPDLLPIYSISKAGVIMATKVMAQQWAPYKIRVNAIAPGLTRTKFAEALWNNPDGDGGSHYLSGFRRLFLHNGPGDSNRRRKDDLGVRDQGKACGKGLEGFSPCLLSMKRMQGKFTGRAGWSSPQMGSG